MASMRKTSATTGPLTHDPLTHDADMESAKAGSDSVSLHTAEELREAEMAAGLQPVSPPDGESDKSAALWFAVGAGISVAAIAVAAAIS